MSFLGFLRNLEEILKLNVTIYLINEPYSTYWIGKDCDYAQEQRVNQILLSHNGDLGKENVILKQNYHVPL